MLSTKMHNYAYNTYALIIFEGILYNNSLTLNQIAGDV